jgi:HEPN domain-containing protein
MTPRVEAWLRQAQSDLAVGKLTEKEGFHSQACYHYSQAAEKALKGLLISLGTLPPYSHSLDRLLEEIRQQGVDITTFQDIHLKAISRMNSETRYPYDDEAPTDRFDEKDSAQARSVAQQVLTFVKSTLRT